MSKGKYLEFHNKDSIVSIGSVRFNRKTKEIVEFRKIDLTDPDSQPYMDTAGRWFSPDPLSEEYSSWSPYNMVLNNPISNIYLDGMQVFTPNGGKNTLWKYYWHNNSKVQVGSSLNLKSLK